MEENPSVGTAMVSRLPKFGGRSSTGGASSLPNGSPQSSIPSQDTKTATTATPPNGLVRKPSFSLKWRREASSTLSAAPTPATSASPEDVKPQEVKPQTQLLLGKEVKSAPPGTPKLRKSGSSLLSVSSPKAIPKQTSKAPSPKLAQSPLRAPKTTQNGSNSPIRPRPMSGSESRLGLPKGTSGLHFSGSQDSLSLSSDSLKNMSMDNMVRSHSFTHFKQIPSPTSQPMTRSFSFNRAVELAKPLANTNLRPPQTSFLKPPQLSNAKVGLGGSLGGLGGGIQYNRAVSAGASVSSLTNNSPSMPTTPTALKKPLLPSCMTTKPLVGSIGGSLGYKLARPGQTKLQKPLFMGRVKGDARPATAPGCGGTSGKDSEDKDTGKLNKADLRSDSDCRGGQLGYAIAAGEALEDMSLSSASSLERGDTSEEFLEDVDSGADTFSDGDMADTKTGSSTQRRLRNFLNETMDWSNIDAAGGKEDVAQQRTKCSLDVSPEGGDLLQGSSLELSPSNSSGGTYMWDEEGLEPLAGAGMLRCDSYDSSELNSMSTDTSVSGSLEGKLSEFERTDNIDWAISNHLEPLSVGDLDDDDLMLELDLSEDFLLQHDSDRMSTGGRSERAGRQGHWRRKQHRWNGPDHFHNDNRGPVFQHYDGPRGQGCVRMQPQPQPHAQPPPSGREDACAMGAPLPDELTLKHMAQDYSSLKNQLLKLQTILQFEDADATATVEEGEGNTTTLQLEELMQEVQVLREELRSRDKTIAQLTLRCRQLQQQQHLQQQTHHTQQQQHLQQLPPSQGWPGRCHCQHQRPPSIQRQVDRRHHDKATQTHLRTHSQTGALAAPLLSLWQAQHQGSARTGMPQRRQILQPSSLSLNPHLHLERLAKPPTVVPSDAWEEEEEEAKEEEEEEEEEEELAMARSALGREASPVSPPAVGESRGADRGTPGGKEPSLLFLLGTRPHPPDRPASGAPRQGGARGSPPLPAVRSGPDGRPPAETPPRCGEPAPRTTASPPPSFCSPSPPCPRVLQPPRLHKRVSLPALPRGAAAPGPPGGPRRLPADLRSRLLPPPSRGLPCFDTGPQAQVQGVERAIPPRPQAAAAAWLLRDPPGPAPGQLGDPGAASKVLLPSSHKRLPRPKNHYGAHQT